MDTPEEQDLVRASDDVDVERLHELYEDNLNDLDDRFDQWQRDHNARFNEWDNKSDDFRRWETDDETGEVFPFEGASDHEVYEIDDQVKSPRTLIMNAVRRASVNATPVGHNETERAALHSQYLRWVMNAKMPKFYSEVDLSIDNFLSMGATIQYIHWESEEQKMKVEVDIEDIKPLIAENVEAFMIGEMDEVLTQYFQEEYKVEPEEASEMVEAIKRGESAEAHTIMATNRPRVRTLLPTEDAFFPSWTIDPDDAPWAYLDVELTPEQVQARGTKEGWDEEFTKSVIEFADTPSQPEEWHYRIRSRNKDLEEQNNRTVRVTYWFEKMLDENDVMGIYVTVFCRGVESYGKHYLLDYAHGKIPLVATALERTSDRFYTTRSVPEIAASAQQIIKAEMDGSVDNLSMSTLPPLLHPPGKRPVRWGPGVMVSAYRPDMYQYAPTPPNNPGSYAMREECRKYLNKYMGRMDEEADPTEVQNKQQDLVNRYLDHLTRVMDQVFTLCQQFGDPEEWFQVVDTNEMMKYTKGKPGERYHFWIDYDVSTMDPANMVKRVEGVGKLGQQLGVTFDNEKLFQIGASALLPGASNQFLLTSEQGQERAIAEERQAISELMAGAPPNVRPNDNHQIKMQYFQQWAQQPDIQQMIASNPALASRVENYAKQRQQQIMQQQNAATGRLGAPDTGFGNTTELPNEPSNQ